MFPRLAPPFLLRAGIAGALALALAAPIRLSAAPPPPLTIIDLGTLPGDTSSFANDINLLGVVVGKSYTSNEDGSDARRRGVVWSSGGIRPLPLPDGADFSDAFGNDRYNRIVGEAGTLGGPVHAVLWQGTRLIPLEGLPGGGNSFGSDINDSGLIAGGARAANAKLHAVFWSNLHIRDFGVLPGTEESEFILPNNRGQGLGDAYTVGPEDVKVVEHAFVNQGAQLVPLGELPGGHTSMPSFLNDLGQAVGTSDAADGLTHAVLWQQGQVIDLSGPFGPHDTTAGANNNFGQIAGTVATSDTDYDTWFWDHGVITDLNSLLPPGSGWSNLNPWVLNDRGQLVGQGIHFGQAHAYRMDIRLR